MASYNVFPAEDNLQIEIKLVGTGRELVFMATECFVALGVFSIERLACQVSMICAVSWPSYTNDVILG